MVMIIIGESYKNVKFDGRTDGRMDVQIKRV